MKHWLIKKLGGFTSVQDALNSATSLADKSAVLTEAVKHLFKAIGPDDILHTEGNQWYFEGKPMMQADVSRLKEEAQQLLSMKIWRVIKLDIRYQLSKKMFEQANTELDLVWGKLITYLDDIIRNRLQKMK